MTDSDKIQTLPLPFLERMKEMLGDDYDAFLKSYKNPRTYGLRVNTAKLSCQDFQALSPFPIRPIPWINTGYFYEEESALHDVLTTRRVFIISRNQVP